MLLQFVHKRCRNALKHLFQCWYWCLCRHFLDLERKKIRRAFQFDQPCVITEFQTHSEEVTGSTLRLFIVLAHVPVNHHLGKITMFIKGQSVSIRAVQVNQRAKQFRTK